METFKFILRFFYLGLFLLPGACFQAQDPVKEINQANPPSLALAPLHFLASDKLMGRATNRPEIIRAAQYISEQFRSIGLKEVPGTKDYFQTFDQPFIGGFTFGSMTLGNKTFQLGKDLLYVKGTVIPLLTAPVVFANFGSTQDIAHLDVRGKIVFTNLGMNSSTAFRASIMHMEEKQKLMSEKGALALIERYRLPDFNWEPIRQVLTRECPLPESDNLLPVFMIHDKGDELPSILQGTKEATFLWNDIPAIRTVKAKNVMGWIEGTDAALKNQFLVLSAHYDHLGVAGKPKMEEGKLDSIYNGARDNALGVTAVMNAARYFTAHQTKRSILFIAYTGEEMGMLGSKYFAAHPPIPLKQLVFNLNVDNGSYNDTTIITLVGKGRTSTDKDIIKACSAYGLTVMPDPEPELNFFDRSDHVSLAAMGVPATMFMLGMKKWDKTITNRYHRLSDEVGNMDTSYMLKFMKSYILSAKYIADNPVQPRWMEGDKYEGAWKELNLSNQKEPVSQNH